MKFPSPLVCGRFVRREKRFFIYAVLDDGREVVAHTNNTGRMTGCLTEGARIWLSPAANVQRKLKWTLEIVEAASRDQNGNNTRVLVGVNTTLANKLVAEAIGQNFIPELAGFDSILTEVSYGSRKSRIDILLEKEDDRAWVEVKNVSLVENGHARFPDAPTERGRKHLLELQEMAEAGDQAVLVFCIQRGDALSVGPADDIDPEYGRLVREVRASGVQIIGVSARVEPEFITVDQIVPIDFGKFRV